MINAGLDKKVALYIDNKRVTDYIYDSGNIYDKIALMKRGMNTDVYDLITGKYKFKIEHVTDVEYSNDSLIVTTTTSGAMGVYDLEYRTIIPVLYKNIKSKGSYYIAKGYNGKMTLFKRNEGFRKPDVIVPEDKGFTDLRLCDRGIITYKTDDNGKRVCGVYSYEGKEMIPAIYKSINFNSFDITVITHDGLEGLYSYSGIQIVPAQFISIDKYGNCYIATTIKSHSFFFGLYYSNGKQILKPTYDYYDINSPLVYFAKDGKKCAYDLYTGKRIAPLKYKHIKKLYNIVSATEDGKNYYIRLANTGKLRLDYPFDNISIYKPHILILETKYRSDLFYLTEIDACVNANRYDVKYEDGKYYIQDIVHENGKRVDKPWELFTKVKGY